MDAETLGPWSEASKLDPSSLDLLHLFSIEGKLNEGSFALFTFMSLLKVTTNG
jgi:hypothetical protein